MLKKTFTYTDFNGNEQTEDFYFHISASEAVEFEFSDNRRMTNILNAIVDEKDNRRILAMFKEIVLMAVGRKSEDGRRFVKNDDIREDFKSSPAYDQLFLSLMTDGDASASFIRAILPDDVDLESGRKKPSDHKQKNSKKSDN